MNTIATRKDSVGTSSAQMNPSMMILSELSVQKHDQVNISVVDAIIDVVAAAVAVVWMSSLLS